MNRGSAVGLTLRFGSTPYFQDRRKVLMIRKRSWIYLCPGSIILYGVSSPLATREASSDHCHEIPVGRLISKTYIPASARWTLSDVADNVQLSPTALPLRPYLSLGRQQLLRPLHTAPAHQRSAILHRAICPSGPIRDAEAVLAE
ncbi:hypothetical protein V492_04306 [Pseudogymnoascus sp. VKM F-4246]|nr:hypothetical protein V492_04306 [Pseudogymnoascus sp. VKM F-4246]